MSERGQMRRRLRERLRVREAMLLDLGALVYELHRQGRRAPALLQRKAAQLTEVDDEVRALQAQLDGEELAPPPADPTDEAYDTAEVEAYRATEHEDDDEELDDLPPDFEDEDEHAHAERMEERAAAEREEQRILAKLEEDSALAEHEEERA